MFKSISKVEGIVECSHNETYKYNYHKWSSFFCLGETSKKMREAISASHKFIKENHVKFLIVDLKDCSDAFSEDDQKWVNDVAIPFEKKLGIQYFVTVVADDFYAELSMEDWQGETEDFITYINVHSFEEAEDWIKAKQAQAV